MSSASHPHLHPSALQVDHSHHEHSIESLSTPLDIQAVKIPANVARPPMRPRRMSISDATLLQQALSHAYSNEGKLSRPTSAEVKKTKAHHTRFTAATAFKVRSPSTADSDADETQHAEVFCLAYSPDSSMLAAGCGDGSIRLFDSSVNGAHRLVKIIKHTDGRESLPVTCIRFKEKQNQEEPTTLIAAEADGRVSQWRFNGALGAQSECIRSIPAGGSNNSIYSVAYAPDQRSFSAAGRDHTVRIYDEHTGALVRAMDNNTGGGNSHGHSNRIYALHYFDQNTLLSGGWDNTVQFWDTRTGGSQRSIFGPHICGDALDVHPETAAEILTGSWREENALQRWDFATGKLIETIQWHGKGSSSSDASSSSASSSSSSSDQPSHNCMIYAASYSPTGQSIAAGGGGNGINEVKLFSTVSSQPQEKISFNHGLYALNFANDCKHLALGGVDTDLTIINL